MTRCCISHPLIPCGFSFILYLSPHTFFPSSIHISASPLHSAFRSKTISQQHCGIIAWRARFQCDDKNGSSLRARVFPDKNVNKINTKMHLVWQQGNSAKTRRQYLEYIQVRKRLGWVTVVYRITEYSRAENINSFRVMCHFQLMNFQSTQMWRTSLHIAKGIWTYSWDFKIEKILFLFTS